MSDDIDGQPLRHTGSGSKSRWTGVGRLRSTGPVPPMLSVALVGAVAGLIVGFGLGYRLGAIAPAPAPTPLPAELQADSVSSRLELAFESAAPGGWAVCSLGREVACRQLVVGPTDPRVPPSEYGLGWYGSSELTRVAVSRAHLVLAASMGQGAATAWLNRIGPGDVFLETIDLTPVNPGWRGTFYFDLGTLGPGHYAIETDFLAVTQSGESSRMVQTYLVGFVVG
jgi:hypothetical protein